MKEDILSVENKENNYAIVEQCGSSMPSLGPSDLRIVPLGHISVSASRVEKKKNY
jgi:hypothetical protein